MKSGSSERHFMMQLYFDFQRWIRLNLMGVCFYLCIPCCFLELFWLSGFNIVTHIWPCGSLAQCDVCFNQRRCNTAALVFSGVSKQSFLNSLQLYKCIIWLIFAKEYIDKSLHIFTVVIFSNTVEVCEIKWRKLVFSYPCA